jgi:undecaprenyl-diphosphatase
MSLREPVRRFDLAADRAWDRLRGRPLVDRLFYSASALGDFSLIWHLLGCGRALLPGHEAEEAVRLSVTMGVESALVNGPVKSLFGRLRPVSEDSTVHPHRLRRPRTTSFPSGHASAAFTAAALLSDGSGRPVRWAVNGVAAVVAASRVHVRIHHASDVIGGAALGIALGAVARRAWTLVPPPLGRASPC